LFAELYSPSWSGVVSVAVPSGAITHIAAFKDPSTDQTFAGSFDGRWLVWMVQRSPQDQNDWEIWAWDKGTNQSFMLAAAPRVDGATIPGPLVEPVVAAGKAGWLQANEHGIGEVHLYSLAARRDQVVGSGATTPIVFWGTDLVWMHLDVPGQSGHFQMVDSTGSSVTVPEPLASVHSLAYLATSTDLVAWTDGTQIWAFKQGQSSASLVYSRQSDPVEFLGIAGDLITWDGTSSPYAFDTRSSSVTALTPGYGGRLASGQSLVLFWPSSQAKSTSGQLLISAVDAKRLPALPGCA
jgi:hypothetical protein